MMYKYIFSTVFALFITFSGFAQEKVQTYPSEEYILIINCHLESVSWNDNFEDAIREHMSISQRAAVCTEHIKALDIKSKDDCHVVSNSLYEKYTRRPDAIVFIGPAGMLFFADDFEKHWEDVPMLHCMLQNYSISLDDYFNPNLSKDVVIPVSEDELKRKYNMTGIWGHSSINETIDLMREVLPTMNHLAVITDQRVGSEIIRYKIKTIMSENYPGISVEYLSPTNMSTNEMLQRVSSFNSTTGILFHTWAMAGSTADDYYITNNLYKLIGKAAKVPVFTLWDMSTSEGYLAGGYFNLMKDQSEVLISILDRVLNGESPRDIPITKVEKARAYLNYSNLESYHLAAINYPDNVFYFDKPENSFYKYRYYLAGLVLLVIFLIIYFLQRISFINREKSIQQTQIKRQKELQQQITLRNFKMALALEVSTVKPWVWDLSQDYILFDDVKKIVEHPTDYHEGEKISFQNFLASIHVDDVAQVKNLFQSLTNGNIEYIKHDCRISLDHDSKYNWYSLQAVVFERNVIGKPIKIIGTVTLITESKELEIELREAKEKAEESNKLKSAFLANISHEIRTPLNAIVGFAGVLAETDDKEEKKELVSIVKHNNHLLLQLIGDILDMSKIESDTMDFSYDDVSLGELFTSLSSDMEELIKDSKLKYVTNCSDPQDIIFTDKYRVKQVLKNLVSNALKFTSQGSVEVGCSISTSSTNRVHFYVKDTGCGIPKSQLKAVFGRFVKLNTFQQGTGLGLSVSQLIVEKLGGQIGVYSTEGIGSEFWFEIPYKRSEKQEAATDASTGNNTKSVILIAEDIPSNYAVLKSMLAGNNFEIIHAWNGREAVDMFKQYSPNLILMDVKMPVLDGYAATAEIRKISDKVPIIAVSAYDFDDKMKKLGFTSVERKPVDEKSLLRKILHSI